MLRSGRTPLDLSRWAGVAMLVVAVVSILIALVSGGASACVCGEFHGRVVAHGSAPNGLPWRIKAVGPIETSVHRPAVEIDVSTGQIAEGDGYRIGLLTETIDHVRLRALSGTAVSSDTENVLGGIATRKATKLEIWMSKGEPLIVRPELAPAALRERFKWLGELRFFEAFFPVDAHALSARIFDHEDRAIGEGEAVRGGFDLWKGADVTRSSRLSWTLRSRSPSGL